MPILILNKKASMIPEIHGNSSPSQNSIHQNSAEQVIVQENDMNHRYASLFPKTFSVVNENSYNMKFGKVSQNKNFDQELLNKRYYNLLEDQTKEMDQTIQLLDIQPSRCRFLDIGCPQASSVHLYNKELLSFDSSKHYLHGNLVSDSTSGLKFFALQHPYPNDELYWTLAYGNGSVLVDLTNLADQNWIKSQDSLNVIYPERQYFPESCINGTLKCGKYTINLIDQIPIEKFKDFSVSVKPTLYTYEIINTETNQNRRINRISYPNWQDNSGILPEQLEMLVDLISDYQKENDYFPMINCKAGVGRTGTLISASIIKMRKQNLTTDWEMNLKEINSVILEVRKGRGGYCVTSEGQYRCLVAFSKYLFKKTL